MLRKPASAVKSSQESMAVDEDANARPEGNLVQDSYLIRI